MKELEEINKQINDLEKKKNKLVKKLMDSCIDLSTKETHDFDHKKVIKTKPIMIKERWGRLF